jgi:hypothetical protein
MYLTSFIHRNALFNIAERWFCNCPESGDVRFLTEILICDGFVINETLAVLINNLLDMAGQRPCYQRCIQNKGELRDIICSDGQNSNPRVLELLKQYRENPDYYYREAPINGVVSLDEHNHLLGSFRIKRPKRIAEKANRKIADWIFEKVIARAKEMAQERAHMSGVPLDSFITSAEDMLKEFTEAEELIAGRFRDGSIRFDRTAATIHDVGAIKIVAEIDALQQLENALIQNPMEMKIIKRKDSSGNYKATKLILEVAWDPVYVSKRYTESRAWERYLDRGIPEEDLKKGLDLFLIDVAPKINIEVILSTFPDMVESEFGNSIHEERIIAQRDNKNYRGYIPMNVEFLVESLFVVGFSPRIDIEQVPIKLWGRYLPETLSSYVRRLYNLPENDLTH